MWIIIWMEMRSSGQELLCPKGYVYQLLIKFGLKCLLLMRKEYLLWDLNIIYTHLYYYKE